MRFLLFLLLVTSALYSLEPITVFYYEDNSSLLNLEDVTLNGKCTFSKLTKTNLGFTDASVWLKVVYANTTTDTEEQVLEFRDTRLDSVEVYDTSGKMLYHMGDMLPFTNRYFNDPNIAIPLTIEPDTNVTYYLRFHNWTKMNLEYGIWTKEAYLAHLNVENSFKAFYFGAVVIMLIYNFMLFIFLRDRAILDYVVYHIALIVVMLYYNGTIAQMFFKHADKLDAGTVNIYLAATCTLMATQFARSFLLTKKAVPVMDKILLTFIWMNAVSIVLSLFNVLYHYNHLFFNITMIIQSIFLLYVGFYMMVKKNSKIAVFYFAGWLTMMFAIIVTAFVIMSVISRNDFTNNFFQIGTLVEVALLSMGLAYRYKINQDQLAEKTKVIHEQAKLASMGEMLRHIAHQWRQPLSEINSVAMKIETDHRRNTLDENSLNKNIEHIENLTEHMSKTIQDFNGYFKSNKEKVERALDEVVDKALDLVWSGLKKSDIRVEKSIESVEKVNIVEGELIQVLLVLLNNARDALNSSDAEEKWIKIRVANENGKHIIEVEDSAGGIDKENLTKVFEPYFTTKFESQGVGIGLYMSKMIVEESMKGILTVSNAEYGAKFKIAL